MERPTRSQALRVDTELAPVAGPSRSGAYSALRRKSSPAPPPESEHDSPASQSSRQSRSDSQSPSSTLRNPSLSSTHSIFQPRGAESSNYPPRGAPPIRPPPELLRMGYLLPPTLRRMCTNAPLVGTTITLLLLLVLYLAKGSTRRDLIASPSSWRPYPYPPDLTTQPEEEPTPLSDLPSSYYAELFPDLQLPASLLNQHHFGLGRRLHSFLLRPILDHAEAQSANEAGCPLRVAGQLVNPDQYNGEWEFWEAIGKPEIAHRRAELVKGLAKRVAAGEEVVAGASSGTGRGIVLTGGNQDTTLRMISVIKHLKRLDVQLPIEVFHYPDELREGSHRKEIEQLGATLREVKGVEKEPGVWKNWQIKGLSIVQSSFREVLYLDSDNTPLRDPSHLFESSIYTDSGRAVFWPDLSKDHPSNAIWRLVGDTCDLDHFTFESGQIVIDKAGNSGLNLAALLLAADMQEDRDFWFHMCGGDKDTFRWAFRMLDIPFGESPRWMSALGGLNPYESGRFCGHTVLQYDLTIPSGYTSEPPLFVHSNLLKHLSAAGLHNGNLFTHVKRMHNDDPKLPILNHVRSWVYTGSGRGMCLDLDWHGTAEEDLTEQERRENYPELLAVDELEGKPLAGFEAAFFEEGGRIGGW
ncbi:mannosyltransferase putative-domain-containing protein [Naematelia encephala]|uniref:Mannosyltransferase putative-domain-containing protein n=1 Tax=Naematelia encephala TaxID=71784 RepID=A0A1Y2BC88_9TREE|nr:mannosyltransferase putative-domain-containing protein [Naematelia encephala]